MDKKKVLVIEDLPDVYESFKNAVQKVDEFELCDYGVCNSLKSAVEMINKAEPDVVFMDHNLTPNGEEGLQILDYLTNVCPKETKIISTTDLKAPNHGGSIVIRKYEDMGYQLSAVSKDTKMVEMVLKSLVVFFYHDEKPKKVYMVHPGFANWKSFLASIGLEKIDEPNDDCIIIITVISPKFDKKRSHGGLGVWNDYYGKYLPPCTIVDQLYNNGKKAVLIEMNVDREMPQLHLLEKYQIFLDDAKKFLTEWIK